MIAPQCERDLTRFRLLLADELPADVAANVSQHIEQCETCRHQLEFLAAESGWWDDAHEYLSSDELDAKSENAKTSTGGLGQSEIRPQELVTSFLQETDNSNALGRLDDYDILEVIGHGGMGIVFKGYDRQLGRHVAVKVLAPHYAVSAAARRRFAREAQAAAAVVHAHVLAIHGVSDDGRLPYLVMPFVAGPSLQERIDAVGPLGTKDTLRIGMQAAQGLAAAHAQGLVHRDVKPGNILLENGVERVLLTDFGLARAIDDVSLTRSGVIAGTPQYMAPEQARGEMVDYRTDLFSLGSVLYAMCTGRPPFRAESTMGVLRRICESTPRDLRQVNPDVPDWLATIINRLLAKAPEDRFQSAAEVAKVLEQCLAHLQHPTALPLPQIVGPPSVKKRPRNAPPGLRSLVLRVTAVVALAGGMSWGWYLLQTDSANQELTPSSNRDNVAAFDADLADGQGTTSSAPNTVHWQDSIDQELFDIDARIRWLEQTDVFWRD